MSMVLILVTICQTEEVIVIASISSVLLENLSRKSNTHATCETTKKLLPTNRLVSANKDAHICRPPSRKLVTILESQKTIAVSLDNSC